VARAHALLKRKIDQFGTVVPVRFPSEREIVFQSHRLLCKFAGSHCNGPAGSRRFVDGKIIGFLKELLQGGFTHSAPDCLDQVVSGQDKAGMRPVSVDPQIAEQVVRAGYDDHARL